MNVKRFKLKNVRLSFPSIFKRSVFEGVTGKYEATFLIKKSDKVNMDIINENINDIVSKAKFKIPEGKSALRDGDESDYESHHGCWTLKASNNMRPLILDAKKEIVIEDDNLIYSGCYVNTSLNFWIQNNKYGKRLNCNLYGVQFYKDGEPFGMNIENIMDDFDESDSDSDSDEL